MKQLYVVHTKRRVGVQDNKVEEEDHSITELVENNKAM